MASVEVVGDSSGVSDGDSVVVGDSDGAALGIACGDDAGNARDDVAGRSLENGISAIRATTIGTRTPTATARFVHHRISKP